MIPTAAHLVNHEHVRALLGMPEPTDPVLDRDLLIETFKSLELIVCNAALSEDERRTLRSFSPAGVRLCASFNAHSWPSSYGSAFHDQFRELTRPAVVEDAFPEYKRGLAAVELVCLTAVNMTSGFDAMYVDELFFNEPTWLRRVWKDRPDSEAARRRWPRVRDHYARELAGLGVFTLANVGAVAPWDVRDQFFSSNDRLAVSIESTHTDPRAWHTLFARVDQPESVLWPKQRDVAKVTVADYGVPGLFHRGCFLPLGFPR